MRPAPIAERVEEIRDGGGGVVCSADFVDLTSAKNAATQLARLASDGLLRRVMRGIYWIAPVGAAEAAGSDSPAAADADRVDRPSLNSIAEAIARSNRWTIIPSGESALAELGLADSAPDAVTFASTGPYASYETESGNIVFRHVADRYIAGLSEATRLFAQVLRAEGRAFATPENARLLASRLTQLEADELLEESAQLPEWMAAFANDVREARIARGKARIKELIARERDHAEFRESQMDFDQLGAQVSAVDQLRDSWDSFLGSLRDSTSSSASG